MRCASTGVAHCGDSRPPTLLLFSFFFFYSFSSFLPLWSCPERAHREIRSKNDSFHCISPYCPLVPRSDGRKRAERKKKKTGRPDCPFFFDGSRCILQPGSALVRRRRRCALIFAVLGGDDNNGQRYPISIRSH